MCSCCIERHTMTTAINAMRQLFQDPYGAKFQNTIMETEMYVTKRLFLNHCGCTCWSAPVLFAKPFFSRSGLYYVYEN